MMYRAWLAPLLILLACGDSEEPSEDEKLAGASKLTSDRAAKFGDYCCYEDGTLMADAPASCQEVTSCFFSQTYSDVTPAGRGTMCGYLMCDE
ncbi:MAG: hypothetical protein RL685_5702 [Pseudomonadota bacterium]|jgi:hypothetical protein